ncbi:MAG: LLM class flavin-dependent oxidoreductase, partial [Acetobacteraceae bacterium]|nr:LLM class flavin-dependent oxidoreductase [Acetobacteraceae bacterium]
MKLGLFLNTQWPTGHDLAARLPEMREQVRAARAAGFASLWFPDHYLTGPLQMPQPTPLAAWLAHDAAGMMIGPNIRILPLLNPVMVAEEAATMDLLTGGNYVLGVGLGYREEEFGAFGIPLAERAPRMTEQIALMRRLWSEERVSHKGRFYTVEAALGCRPVTPGGPPVYVAGKVEAAVRRAARIGDAWHIVPSDTLGTLVPLMATYRAALAEYGRPAREFPLTRECHVGATHAEAMAECRAALRYKYAAYAAWGLHGKAKGDDDIALFGMPFEEFARDRFIIGDKASVAEEVARYREALGIDHLILRVQWPGLPQAQALASIRRLGE